MEGRSRLSDELAIIPRTAVVIAILVFPIAWFIAAGVSSAQFPPSNWPTRGSLLVASAIGLGVAIWVLLVGYVIADASRRRMSRLLWAFVVILVPNALGFILYFLLRDPVLSPCPECSSPVEPRASYCPRCGESLSETCPSCSASVELNDVFCANCGHALRQATTEA